MVKGKESLCLIKYHAMKTYWQSDGTVLHTNLGTRWRWGQLHVLSLARNWSLVIQPIA